MENTPTAAYDAMFASHLAAGCSPVDAAAAVAEAYLDGKPVKRGKHKITRAERDAAYWASGFLMTLPREAWQTEPLVLALARYMGQERTSNLALLHQLAVTAPETVRRAVRYSGLVLQQHSPRRVEIDRLAEIAPAEFDEFVRVLDAFDQAHRQRLTAVEMRKTPFKAMHPLELLIYASLYAFERLVPQDARPEVQPDDPDARSNIAWHAINDLLTWKLAAFGDASLGLTERGIATAVGTHLSPFLFPSPDGSPPREDLYEAFTKLLLKQIELNSFISRSADAFSYDDGIEFVLQGAQLVIVERNTEERAAWVRDGARLERLNTYWLYRALDAFIASGMATAAIGRPENHDANQLAYIQAIRTQLQLAEVYGITDSVTTESGARVDLLQAHLSMELMKAFFEADFVRPYLQYLGETGNWREALSQLALDGLAQPGVHIRFPITWSDRSAKIANITGWTVNKEFPRGSEKAAEAILDFWTSDWSVLAKELRQGQPGIRPQLFERPVLKMGRHLFQLPWVIATQNNTTAALNNLRRLGSRRAEARAETQRIEQGLATRFEERGFRVLTNFQPERTAEDDPGEIDLICASDGLVLVLEIKSTFLRASQKEAWLHGSTTLRKAGLQVRRKLRAVKRALAATTELASTLGIDPEAQAPIVRGWIVDTSIEHDHRRFAGFLKISLEEVLIALRDDRHLLSDTDGLRSGASVAGAGRGDVPMPEEATTLYPGGFTAPRFLEVIESAAVWDLP